MNTATVSTTAALGGNALFSYNRENYMFDAGLRWARYMTGYTFAIDQVAMYREDIDQLGDCTIAKMDNIHAVSGLMMVIVIQLIMAGRLGVHGPAPPTWLMGMYWVNASLMCTWLMCAAWFAIHGGARCQAGVTYLKTRSVRLPIPTPKQLDKARVYGNHWERQRGWDVFRVPFVTPAPVDDPVDHRLEESDGSSGSGSKSDGSSKAGRKKCRTAGPVTDFRTPGWVNEEIRELHGGSGGAAVIKGETTPEHFELFRGLQHEWWQFETYSRIAIFFAFTHWMAAASLYIQSHCFIELRDEWPAYSCTAILVAAHYCLNTIDIARVQRDDSFFNVPMELIVPFPPLLCSILMGIDYSVLEEYRSGWVVFVWVCSFICYLIYFLYSIRMYDLCKPTKAAMQNAEDKFAGRPWWPSNWNLPVSFQHCMYLVAPPTHLEPGESCLWQEMKAGRGTHNANVPNTKQKETPTSNAAWRVCQGACVTSIFLWAFIILGRLYDMAWVKPESGDMRYMLKQEGRVMRWPSHMQPWMTPWTRLGTRNEWCHTGGCDRRLGERQSKSRHQMATAAEMLVPKLQSISDILQQEEQAQIVSELPKAVESKISQAISRAAINFPANFRPEHLTCSHHGPIAALARTGHSGVIVPNIGGQQASDLQHFVFNGIEHLGEVLGSHWGQDSMLLTTKSGHLAECTGAPLNGAWSCSEMGSRLPMGGSSLRKAVAARVPHQNRLLRAAIVYEDDASVTLFETDGESGVWFPTGQAHLPSFLEKAPSFSMSLAADELVLLTESGGALKWMVNEAEPVEVAPPPSKGLASSTFWHSACRLNDERLVRLGHRQSEGSMVPEIFLSN